MRWHWPTRMWHLLENNLFFSPYPTFPDFQGRERPQRKGCSLQAPRAGSLSGILTFRRELSAPAGSHGLGWMALGIRPFLWPKSIYPPHYHPAGQLPLDPLKVPQALWLPLSDFRDSFPLHLLGVGGGGVWPRQLSCPHVSQLAGLPPTFRSQYDLHVRPYAHQPQP